MTPADFDHLLAALDIRPPGDIRAVTDAVARHRGRNIVLIAGPAVAEGSCGMWIRTAAADYVVYDASAPEKRQEVEVFHELGHMLAGHQGKTALEVAPAYIPRLARMPELMAFMLTEPDPARVLCRDGVADAYADQAETEAEVIATLLVGRSDEARREGSWTARPGREEAVARARQSLGRPWRH